ncbi:MAG: co-chaperone GroES [Alphaproteobacteria bacterium]
MSKVSPLVLPNSAEWKAMMGESAQAPAADMEELFPSAAPGIEPLGGRILIQLRTPRSKTKGGVLLTEDTKANEQWNEMTGKVIAVGPVAFKKRDDLQEWPEGQWVKPGDFVRVGKYGGDRWSVDLPDRPGEKALFVTVNDYDLLGKVTADPRDIKAWV